MYGRITFTNLRGRETIVVILEVAAVTTCAVRVHQVCSLNGLSQAIKLTRSHHIAQQWITPILYPLDLIFRSPLLFVLHFP